MLMLGSFMFWYFLQYCKKEIVPYDFPFSILNSQFSILNSQFSIRSASQT